MNLPFAPSPLRPLILCPLEFERAALQRVGLMKVCEVVCCGPGAEGIARWARDSDAEVMANRPIILAGLAGALDPSIASRQAYIVAEVVDPTGGTRWTPTLRTGDDDDDRSIIITSAEKSVTTPAAKRALRAASGAALVDLESIAFARTASERGWRWAIVRGVSDDAQSALPGNIDEWVDGRGRTRNAVVAGSLLRRPWLIPTLIRLGKHSDAAMQAVARVLTGLGAK